MTLIFQINISKGHGTVNITGARALKVPVGVGDNNQAEPMEELRHKDKFVIIPQLVLMKVILVLHGVVLVGC